MARPIRYGNIKPPPGAQIDWGHPLAQGLVYATLCDSPRPFDYVNNRHPFSVIDIAHTIGSDATSIIGTSNLRRVVTHVPKVASWSGTPITLAAHARLFYLGVSTYPRIIMLNTTQGSGDCVVLRIQNAGRQSIAIEWIGSVNMIRESIALDFSQPVTFTAVGTHAGGANYSSANIYYQGLNVNDDSASQNGSGLYQSDGNIILMNSYAQDRPFDGAIYCAMVWNRVFTSDEARWWSNEPYSMFYYEPPVVYSIPSLGGGSKSSAKIYIAGSASVLH